MSTATEQHDDRAALEGLSQDEVISFVAGVCAMAAGVIHLVVVPHHLSESTVIGVLFLGLGLAQVGLGVAFRWTLGVKVLMGAVVVHVVVVMLYVASRTRDLPFMPPHDVGHSTTHLPVQGGVGNGVPIYPGSRIEPVGPLDAVCLVAELVLIAMMTALLPPRARGWATSAMAVVAVLAVAGRVTHVLL